MNTKLFARSLTAIDRFRRNKPTKVEKPRRSRTTMMPGIDSLDGRVLLAGNVLASVSAGTLSILGDAGNNTILLATSPLDPTKLRVTGSATTVNSVLYKEFAFSDFTKLSIDMGSGKDSVSLTKFKVGTSIQIVTSGTGDDKISLDTVTTTTLNIYSNNTNPPAPANVQNPKSDVMLNNDTVTGTTTVLTGNGNDSITVLAGKYGNVNINTGDNLNFSVSASVPVDAVYFSPVSAKAVSIVSGTGDHAIDVVNTSVNSLYICAGNSSSGYACDCVSLHTSHINVANVEILKSVAGYSLPCVLPGQQSTPTLDGTCCPPYALYICAGDNIDINVDTVTALNGDIDISVGANTWDPMFNHVSMFNVSNSNAKAMHLNVGDGDYDIMIANDNAVGGTGFTLNTQGVLGTGDKNILLSALNVDGDYSSTYGDSVFVVIVSNNALSNNVIVVDTVTVDVTSPIFSFISGNFGPLNDFFDIQDGTSWGFDVINFV